MLRKSDGVLYGQKLANPALMRIGPNIVRSHDFRASPSLDVAHMPKQKPSAQILVADGVGGMRQVVDLRFEAGAWPIEIVVPAKDAETWMAHLNAETEERGWNSSSFSQLDATENSGTLSVHTANGPSPGSLEIVWERPRGKELRLRVRPSGEPVLPLDVAHAFIDAVSARVRTGKTLRAHRQALLTYDGLPWRGELWLDADHRLGPPSKHPDTLFGPQIVIVDAMIEGIGQQGVTANFQRRLHELRVFLGFVLGLNITISKFESGWVCDINSQGSIMDCSLRQIGYIEIASTQGFPAAGSARPIERRAVTRPGLGPYGITSDMHEEWIPDDIEQLWDSFVRLPSPKREHLLRAGNAYLIAKSMWPDQRTAYVAFLVVTCEALKPTGKRYDRLNAYDVIASLVSASEAQRLHELSIHPQKVRSEHVHRGELAAGELLPMLMHNHFMDPSFDEMLRVLATISRMCLIEWLRRGGNYSVVRIPRYRSATPTKAGVVRRVAKK